MVQMKAVVVVSYFEFHACPQHKRAVKNILTYVQLSHVVSFDPAVFVFDSFSVYQWPSKMLADS